MPSSPPKTYNQWIAYTNHRILQNGETRSDDRIRSQQTEIMGSNLIKTYPKPRNMEDFSKKFPRLQKEEEFVLQSQEKIKNEILVPLACMQYELHLYDGMNKTRKIRFL